LTALKVVYSDESLTDSKEAKPVTVVTALLLDMDSQWPLVSKDVSAIGHPGEFKGKQLFYDLRKNTKEKPDSERCLTQLLSIPFNRGIQIFYGAVDEKGLARLT
jgi:hypothetical protein